MNSQSGKVMVVGGGIAGLTAAWELARQNVSVELVEKGCFLGGHSIGYTCKATDTCQQCGACSVEKMLKNVVGEPLINVHLRTEVGSVDRAEGFKVSLKKSGDDAAQGRILKGFSRHNAPLYVKGEDVTEEAPEGAMGIGEMGSEGEIDVDAVILATGFAPFDAEVKGTYGYGKWENVITGLEFENIVRENAGIVRPSDGKRPEKVAFIQCVGSRDERLGNLWCSEVCCPYAMRMAGTIKHDNPDAEVSIFYIDVQNTGKEFPVFYEKIRENVRFVRTIPVDIYPIENDGLKLRHMAEDEGSPSFEEFDLVVLSVGIMPGADSKAVSETFDIPLTVDGFLDDSVDSGVFVAGTAAGPGTIAASMAGAGKIAYDAVKFLGGAK
ncbi:MAG: CoB--CoM heterodisulfide reductase iron-sulfur subunit A family protein [Desulfobacteraceae bacterium]|nr:CoB--CoM heterodisulfide reductase iron-sulfur subunit A family protein [Desulfobacteraceae bacterium]